MENNMEDLANLTVPNPVMEVSSTPMNIFNEKVGKTVTDKFSTPVKSTLPPIDSRTITRPSKRAQNLPEVAQNSPEITQKSAVKAQPDDLSSSSEQISRSSTESAVSTKKSEKHQQEQTGGENKPSHRARQRTITVQSQISHDIANAFSEAKQRRVFALVSAKEKEWSTKLERAGQLLAHEQKRNEPLEQRAAERLLAMHEYEKLIKELVDELKEYKNGRGSVLANSPSRGHSCGLGSDRVFSQSDIALLIKERDQLSEEVNSLELSYCELFHRYEKLRQTSIEIKKYGDDMKSECEEISKRYMMLTEKFNALRANAEEQLNLANDEVDNLLKQHESDTLALRLKVKQLESKNETLTISLNAKQKEVDQMTALFEEVINKAEANTDVDE